MINPNGIKDCTGTDQITRQARLTNSDKTSCPLIILGGSVVLRASVNLNLETFKRDQQNCNTLILLSFAPLS